MITTLNGSFRKILRRIRTGKILNKIGSGKRVFFEIPLEHIAFKYIPGKLGKLGKYFTKQYGRNESELDFDSTFVKAVMEGKQISRATYDKYHLIDGGYKNGRFKITERTRQWATSA